MIVGLSGILSGKRLVLVKSNKKMAKNSTVKIPKIHNVHNLFTYSE